MTDAKICGITDPGGLAAALSHGAAFVGFVFFPPSPRSLGLDAAAALARRVPAGKAIRTALLVDPESDLVGAVAARVGVDLIQLHGAEPPERCAEIRALSGLPVMKAVRVAEARDFDGVRAYEAVCDRLLFDAKPKPGEGHGLPGGNAVAFDWTLMEGRRFAKPWMLAGGLTPDNVKTAIRLTGAPAVDTSSGVEDAPGVKNPEKIRRFLEACNG